MKKLRIFVLLFILAFSFNVKAEVFFEIDCDTHNIIGEEPITCDGILNYEDDGVNDIELSYNTNLDISFIPVKGFTMTSSKGKVTVHSNKALSDSMMNSTKIMEVTLKANSKSKDVESVTFFNAKINKSDEIVVDEFYDEFNVSFDNKIKLDSNCTLDSISIDKVKISKFNNNVFVYRDIKVTKNVVFVDAKRTSDKSSVTGLGEVKILDGETIERDVVVVAEDGTKNIYKLFITNTKEREDEIKVPDEVLMYPDFTDGTWNEDKINSFCSEHQLNCQITKESNTDVEKGIVISQSIPKGKEIVNGSSITIKISDKEEEKSNDNTLKALEVYYNNKRINFDYSNSTDKYDILIAGSGNKKVTIKATLNDEKATFVSGYGPRDINFNSNDNEVLVKVKAENNDEKTYTLMIHFSKDENYNKLSSLIINDKEINLGDEKYEVRLPYSEEKTRVKAKASNEKATIEYQDIDLKVGDNHLKISINTPDNETNEYDVNVIREEEVVLFEKIEIVGYSLDFSKDKKSYTLKVDKDTNELDIKIEPSNIDFEVLNNTNLHNGSKIKIIVTDNEGRYEYIIQIEKDDVTTNLICYGVFGIGVISVIVSIMTVLRKKKKNM